MEITARIKNDSRRAGDEVAQLYVAAGGLRPELKGFIRTHLAAGQSKRVRFVLSSAGLQGAVASVGGGQPGTTGSLSLTIPKS